MCSLIILCDHQAILVMSVFLLECVFVFSLIVEQFYIWGGNLMFHLPCCKESYIICTIIDITQSTFWGTAVFEEIILCLYSISQVMCVYWCHKTSRSLFHYIFVFYNKQRHLDTKYSLIYLDKYLDILDTIDKLNLINNNKQNPTKCLA